MKKRRLYLSVLLVLTLGIFFSYNIYNDIALKKELEPKGYASWASHYNDIDSLIKESDVIIIGKCVDSYTEKECDFVITNEIMEINKIYKGDVQKKDRIKVIQTGGIYDDIITPPFADAPLFEKNGNYILFLEKRDDFYLVLGGYQGSGKIKKNEVKFYSNGNDTSKELNKLNLEEIDGLINEKLTK